MRNPFIIYPKYVATLRMADHIFSKTPCRNGIYSEYVDDFLYVISTNRILCECVVFLNDVFYDGFVTLPTDFKFNDKTITEIINENI